jgi:hypothetical protein
MKQVLQAAARSDTAAEYETMAPLPLAYEAELRAYFGCYCPGAPGERSNFGAICARMAAGRPSRSAEQPTPGTPWTEIVECSRQHGAANFDGEDAMVAYLDARRRFRKVCDALSRLSARDQDVLEAHYGGEPQRDHALGQLAAVAWLTDTAQRRNRARAARGIYEPMDVTVRSMIATATTAEGRATLGLVRREAAELLDGARRSYAGGRSRR